MPKTLDDFVNEALAVIEEISVEEAARILEQPDREGWVFVDVREGDEFAAGRVPGARHAPRGFLEVHADREHPKRDPWFEGRDRKLILYCGGGNRSALAARTLTEMGFTRVISMAGGFAAWTAGGFPVEA
jgi:rhodanese-related sulfurtransferase